MDKITPESIANLKALFQDNEKALGANFSQLIDFFNNNKVTDNGDGTFTVGTVTVDASKLYNLINNSSPNILPLDNEFTGKNTFDIAPINKANGKPYITADSVPPVDLSNYATQQQLATKADDSTVLHSSIIAQPSGTDLNTMMTAGFFQVLNGLNTAPSSDNWTIYQIIPLSGNNGVQIAYNTNNNMLAKRTWSGGNKFSSWVTFANTNDVTTAISAATANMADTTKATNFTNGLQSGGVNVATAADIKSIEDSAWRPIISNSYSGLCMMKYNADTETMSLSGTIFPKTYSTEGSRVAVIIPLPDGFSMGENADSKTTLWSNVSNSVQLYDGVIVDLKFESDGVHIVFDKMYANRISPAMFIVLDGFFSSSIPDLSGSSFINFKVNKN